MNMGNRSQDDLLASDANYADAMKLGSRALLERIQIARGELLTSPAWETQERIRKRNAQKSASFHRKVQIHTQARDAIRMGFAPDEVKKVFGLSETAYWQLAGQVRG